MEDLICGLPPAIFAALSWQEQAIRRQQWNDAHPVKVAKLKREWRCNWCSRTKKEVTPDPQAWDGGICTECSATTPAVIEKKPLTNKTGHVKI